MSIIQIHSLLQCKEKKENSELLEYSRLKQTDLNVFPICMGTGQYGSSIDETLAQQQLNEFSEVGENFIDTVHVLGNWIEGLKSPSENLSEIKEYVYRR